MTRVGHHPVGLGLALALVMAGPVLAQGVDQSGHRIGEPPVLAQPRLQTVDHQGRFSRAWRNAGAPRIAVLWNRELSEEVSTAYRQRNVVDLQSKTRASAHLSPGSVGAEASHSTRLEIETGVTRTDAPQRASPAEAMRWDFESAFAAAFQEAGVKLVSRAVAMRRDGVAESSGRPNLQALEMKALRRHADYVLELLMTPSPDGVGGFRYRVRVTQLASARVVADLTTAALRPASPETQYVATSHGFQPAEPAAQTMSEAAREVARQTMIALTDAFARR